MVTRRAALLAAATATLLAACGETGVEVGRPLDLQISVQNASRPLGSAHHFAVEAQGRRLIGVVIDFGDGRLDSIPAHAAQSASISPSHTYAAAGSYRVLATVEDMVEGMRRDSLTVHATPLP